ncbi:MAG: CZB domain-containing protein [Nitrosomonadales bacterium]|nr:CZB domain-containing protein [Nitrosomonadales bacterium]
MALFSELEGWSRLDADFRHDMRDGVNLLGAAEKHILWKNRLGHHVQGSIREPVEGILVGQSGICQLGSWLNGVASELLRELPEFEQLQQAHQRFHHLGGQIIEKLQVGHREQAAVIFRNEYNQALRHVIQGLTGLNKHLQGD